MKNIPQATGENTTMQYTLRDDESGTTLDIKAVDLDAATEQAHEWAAGGDYDDTSTIWVDTTILDADGDVVARVTTSIDPETPRCSNGGRTHQWASDVDVVGGIAKAPGVWGHGGGVTIAEACSRCGCGRHTDTWAQRPDTGEQGFRSVHYVAGEYSEALAAAEEDSGDVTTEG